MSKSNWDWWFGDAPPRPRAAWMLHWLQNMRRSRRPLAILLAGGMTAGGFLMGADIGFADEPVSEPVSLSGPEVRVASLPSGFFAATRFTMIDGDDEGAGQVSGQVKAKTEDELRRERLRDLLRDDSDVDTKADQNDDEKTQRKDGEDDEEDVFAQPFLEERLPELTGGRFELPSLKAVSLDTTQIGNGRLPDDFDASKDVMMVTLPEDAYARGMVSPGAILPWAAPNTYSHPLYFEDRMLERHGHERWGCLQPIASGARFFTTIPMLPYLATIQEPCDIVYSKGYFRAGSIAPRVVQRPPLERRAVLVEAAAIAGGMIAIP